MLHAGNVTKAIVNEGDAFQPLLLCSAVQNDFTVTEWQKNVSVAADGTVAYQEEIPNYPHQGDYIYVAGIYPSTGSVSGGKAVFHLDGRTDLMYAPGLAGNRWNGFRIYGNSDPSKDKTLQFGHLLTQLQLTAIRTASELTGKKEFRILSIRLKNIPQQASVRLGVPAEGEERVVWSDPVTQQPVYFKDASDTSKNTLITSSDPDNPDRVGWILLPPEASYQADIETTVGNFSDIRIRPDEGEFTGGLAHRVVLILNDKGLSVMGVKKEDWADTDGGEIEMN